MKVECERAELLGSMIEVRVVQGGRGCEQQLGRGAFLGRHGGNSPCGT